ncbi:uncharacterized protein LOC122757620 [Drosophila mojavensis]|uniref:uncharacterized protein LOC122757620 n=1 Tax=Drosophila mojavensis TaxID=7230 RepID=UPI001CD10F67|nr:uncharacterized protein LOC122757620 [Drosophila mojavensis]
MADLPKERAQCSPAFTITGVDYCGPFYYKPDRRNRASFKCYICVFVCFTTKAVWLELAKDLSTAAFLGALKRFISTRGIPKCIWSDNATNFVGARNELADLRRLLLSQEHRNEVHKYCMNNSFDWKFIPPRHILAAFGRQLLRPLKSTYIALWDRHFLASTNCAHCLDRWQRMTYIQQLFWKRWSEEYLIILQQRGKWRTPRPSVKINDVVCVKDENLPPLKWPLPGLLKLLLELMEP